MSFIHLPVPGPPAVWALRLSEESLSSPQAGTHGEREASVRQAHGKRMATAGQSLAST